MPTILKSCAFLIIFSVACAQPANWPLLAKLPTNLEQGALRGSGPQAQWTPVSAVDGQQVVDSTIGNGFLLEVESMLGAKLLDGKHGYFVQIADTLHPTFDSLEKNEYGNLGHTAVRYALHRLFVARHGWVIKGLDPAGKHFNSSSPVEVFRGKIPARVQGMFDLRLGGRGFGLEELVVFAALLEALIWQEAVEKLGTVYDKLDFSVEKKISLEELRVVMEVYLTAFVLGLDVYHTDAVELISKVEQMGTLYAGWDGVQELAHEIRIEELGNNKFFTFSEIAAVLIKFSERFGQWQNSECTSQKKLLMELEGKEKGCVPISSFYKPMLKSNGQDWHFSETPEYLQANGIVDSSDPKNMKVMVPNYLSAQSNCIATSGYYFICCMDECESLLGQVERHVQGPTALPSTIAAFISHLPTSTEPANRTLAPLLLRRLESIAEKHGGRVPIHGRLFMQWMHNVYPRECAYPYVSGTKMSFSPDQWFSITGREANTSVAEIKSNLHLISDADVHARVNDGQCGRWQDEEELVVSLPPHRQHLRELETDVHTWMAASSVALLCAAVSMALAAISTFKSMRIALSRAGSDKRGFMVI
jgi:hypothetical protein